MSSTAAIALSSEPGELVRELDDLGRQPSLDPGRKDRLARWWWASVAIPVGVLLSGPAWGPIAGWAPIFAGVLGPVLVVDAWWAAYRWRPCASEAEVTQAIAAGEYSTAAHHQLGRELALWQRVDERASVIWTGIQLRSRLGMWAEAASWCEQLRTWLAGDSKRAIPGCTEPALLAHHARAALMSGDQASAGRIRDELIAAHPEARERLALELLWAARTKERSLDEIRDEVAGGRSLDSRTHRFGPEERLLISFMRRHDTRGYREEETRRAKQLEKAIANAELHHMSRDWPEMAQHIEWLESQISALRPRKLEAPSTAIAPHSVRAIEAYLAEGRRRELVVTSVLVMAVAIVLRVLITGVVAG